MPGPALTAGGQMKKAEFDTGQEHQRRTATSIRKRLAGTPPSRQFLSTDDQDGVLLADAVGMGKTWEALAGAALLLMEKRRQRGHGRVLVICPPNLITKWEEELA